MHWARGRQQEKEEEKVRRLSREGRQGYIDRAGGMRQQAMGTKAARTRGRSPKRMR